MRKIVLLCPPIPPNHLGGDGKFALDIAQALSNKGFEIILFTLLYNDSQEPYYLNDRLRIIPIPIEDKEAKDKWDVPIWDPSFTKARDTIILKYLKNFDVLNDKHWIHEIGGSLYNNVLRHIYDQRISYSCHMQFVLEHYFHYFPEPGEFAQTILASQKRLVESASLSMFLSNFDRSAFEDTEGNKTIIPNGTLVKKRPPNDHKNRRSLHLYYGGRLHSQMKGASAILPVLSEVMKNHPNIIVHISAPDRTYLNLVDDSVSNRLIYHGWLTHERTLELIQSCDLSLMPSVYEPFGLLAIESLAQGVPVLANQTGGLADIIIPGKNGEFIDLNDPDSSVRLLTKVAKDKDYINTFAPEPYFALERYDIDHVADLYQKALNEYLN